MARISRRSLIAGSLLVPIAGVGLRGALAQENRDEDMATPGASPAASPVASPMASPAAGADAVVDNEVTVVAVDIDFVQEELRIPADTDVIVILINEGVLLHDWVVEELDVFIPPIEGGEEAYTTVNAPAGEYQYFCSIPGHAEAGMVGTLIVE